MQTHDPTDALCDCHDCKNSAAIRGQNAAFTDAGVSGQGDRHPGSFSGERRTK